MNRISKAIKDYRSYLRGEIPLRKWTVTKQVDGSVKRTCHGLVYVDGTSAK